MKSNRSASRFAVFILSRTTYWEFTEWNLVFLEETLTSFFFFFLNEDWHSEFPSGSRASPSRERISLRVLGSNQSHSSNSAVTVLWKQKEAHRLQFNSSYSNHLKAGQKLEANTVSQTMQVSQAESMKNLRNEKVFKWRRTQNQQRRTQIHLNMQRSGHWQGKKQALLSLKYKHHIWNTL